MEVGLERAAPDSTQMIWKDVSSRTDEDRDEDRYREAVFEG